MRRRAGCPPVGLRTAQVRSGGMPLTVADSGFSSSGLA